MTAPVPDSPQAVAGRIRVALDEQERLARAATPGPWSSYTLSVVSLAASNEDADYVTTNDPAHVLAVLAAAREELADAVAQQERHAVVGSWCQCCTENHPCDDQQQASRTLARLLALYGAS